MTFFRFSLECETYYTPDGGSQENIFQLPDSEKRDRIVDLIDIVKDNVSIPKFDKSEEKKFAPLPELNRANL